MITVERQYENEAPPALLVSGGSGSPVLSSPRGAVFVVLGLDMAKFN
jgi:hypothetical protein